MEDEYGNVVPIPIVMTNEHVSDVERDNDDEDRSSELSFRCSNISEMYVDLEGSDDDIFSRVNDKGSQGRYKDDNNHEYAQSRANVESVVTLNIKDLKEDDYKELYEKQLKKMNFILCTVDPKTMCQTLNLMRVLVL
ncbi:hypothetical protein GH714_007818 [Hevea brasiliensis]|uniref:Uncharacterized protein n=1 Tax=Hevea brasiliensis TaxID=3981 RepID=A0A6A6MXE3_HEVBR|nr:hypothetical protein GH714_007818 [Hevea brasiliensis]